MPGAIAAGAVGALVIGLTMAGSPASSAAVNGINPVRVQVDGHPANSGFLTFVERNVGIHANESEGTVAMGGDLLIDSNYNVAAGSPPVFDTIQPSGDARPTYLYVGGGVQWLDTNARVQVHNQGFTKIADTSTYDAFDTDNNGAAVNYRIVEDGASYLDVPPAIDGTTRQSPESIASPAADLLDISDAFVAYRSITDDLAACAATVQLTDAQGNPLDEITPGTQGYVHLQQGVTNVLTLHPGELGNLSELSFRDQPSADTPLLINIVGGGYDGVFPNLAGVSGAQAPYMLWNFPDATNITARQNSATVEGTIFAPNATLRWLSTGNIEGNIISVNLQHGGRDENNANELHDFPFQAELTCSDATPTPSPTPTPTPSPSPSESTSPTPSPSPSPSETTTPTSSPSASSPAPSSPAPSSPAPSASESSAAPVPGQSPSSSAGGLASTGGPPIGPLVGGVVLILAGSAVLILRRVLNRS
ncbi:choice-of-anchor A family protein [Microlunatus elymi]|uniref:Choice-of-anchor A family protein n=1 Tax=Microlunatus elymi TaxID=2596828 RepID=A0A516PY10_9ACTN|nr:collagen-binding domain-containing protein [Microlunatus elymi]QDP96065.1 choice-of-anchor A family protein [Microlunatus elymi]